MVVSKTLFIYGDLTIPKYEGTIVGRSVGILLERQSLDLFIGKPMIRYTKN